MHPKIILLGWSSRQNSMIGFQFNTLTTTLIKCCTLYEKKDIFSQNKWKCIEPYPRKILRGCDKARFIPPTTTTGVPIFCKVTTILLRWFKAPFYSHVKRKHPPTTITSVCIITKNVNIRQADKGILFNGILNECMLQKGCFQPLFLADLSETNRHRDVWATTTNFRNLCWQMGLVRFLPPPLMDRVESVACSFFDCRHCRQKKSWCAIAAASCFS